MKSLSYLLMAILFFTSTVTAQVVSGEFKLGREITKIKEGDLVEATLRVWPIESADLTQFKKLEKQVFFNSFYLAQITSLGLSANNADVVELKGIFIIKTAKPQTIHNLKYNDSNIEIRLDQIKIAELENKEQNFYILNQSLNASMFKFIIMGLIAVVFVVLIIKRKAIEKALAQFRPDMTKKSRRKYDEVFRVASKREDFEKIYLEKEIWLNLLQEKAPAHLEFLKTLNQHQFKKDWGSEELSEVRSSFDVIRRSFEKC